MSEWVSGTLGFLERIPKVAFQVSIPLIAIGGCLMVAMRIGLVRDDAFQGYVADAGPVALSIGFAILLVGVLFAAFGQLRKIPLWLAAREKARIGQQHLLENMRFLPDDALFVLLDILNQPSGRVPSVGDIQTLSALGRLSLVGAENPYASVTDRGTMLRVNPLLFNDRDQVKGYIKTILMQRGNSITLLEDNKTVSNRAQKTIRAEVEAREERYGGF